MSVVTKVDACPAAVPSVLTDDERVITTTSETTPKDTTHWSTRSMAAHAVLSQAAVSRIWRVFGLQPRRQDM
jgi:DNA-binding MurR/RpiR family transcriptional regulator